MPGRIFLSLFLLLAIASAFLFKYRKKAHRTRRTAAADRSLWGGIAAGLFDASENSSPSSRVEIALLAIAGRIGMRAGMVSLVNEQGCQVMAAAGMEENLVSGLERGNLVPFHSVYCGSLRTEGQFLAINYASLSEWRKHSASRDRGWESYVGVNCGDWEGRGAIVISFFDSAPREQLVGQAERNLVEQVGPWITAMLSEESFPVSPALDSITLNEPALDLRG